MESAEDAYTGWSEVAKKQISNKEYERYQQYQTDKLHGRIQALYLDLVSLIQLISWAS